MKEEYDIVLHYEWVHVSCLHKYLSLNKRLNKVCKSLLVLNSGALGICQSDIDAFNKRDLYNVKLMSMDVAVGFLNDIKYKIYVFGSSGNKGSRPCMKLARNSGSLVVETSDILGDMYPFNPPPHVFSLISPIVNDMIWFGHPRKIYSNCLLWDNIDDCLPYSLSKKEFCEKYNLVEEKPIYLWLPDNCQESKPAQDIFKKVVSIENVLTKLHPNEYNGRNKDMYGDKFSFEGFLDSPIKILDQIDMHWAFKYVDCGIGYTTSIGVEFGLNKKPFVYVDVDSRDNQLFRKVIGDNLKGHFSWVGGSCTMEDLPSYLLNRKFESTKEDFDKHAAKFLVDPNRKSADILIEQLLEFLNEKNSHNGSRNS